jgi:hypothetical protein
VVIFQTQYLKSAISAYTFSYIAVHPWIKIITIQDLMTSPDLQAGSYLSVQNDQANQNLDAQQSLIASDSKSVEILSTINAGLLNAPKSQLTDFAWQVFDSLLRSGSPELFNLRLNYIGQIGEILAATDWGKKPVPIQSCSRDLDFDGENECILANNHIFAVIEPDGGYIPFVFTNDDQGIHQIIGPTWEFIVGMSDPSSWNTFSGVRSDSAQILGAFQDQFTS